MRTLKKTVILRQIQELMVKKRKKKKTNHLKPITVFLISLVILIFFSIFLRITHLPTRKQETEIFKKSFTIDIQNACGEDGTASLFSRCLKNAGFDVINIGNFNRIEERSYIISKEGLPKRKINFISSITGIDSITVDTLNYFLFDLTIILGRDYIKKSHLFIRRYSGN